MNDNRQHDRPTGADDQELGAALGEAVGREADSPVAPPPVANIAERAAARAKARRVRHGVVAVAAAAALVGGGLATWNALDGNNGDGSVLVATQPDVPEQAEPAADQSAPVAGEADPAAVPQPGEPRANEIAPPAPQPADPPAADPDEVVEDSRGESSDLASEVPTPEDLSTGPTLTWTEVSLDASTGLTDVYGMESVGDGRIIARAWGDAGDSVVVTTDGTTWSDVPMPAGISPDYIDIAGDRWLVGGPDTTGAERVSRAFFSDDEGATWTELAIAVTPAASMPSYCPERSRVRSVVASGDSIVLLIDSYAEFDLAALLVERGLASDRDSILQWDYTASTLVVYLGDSSNPETVEVTHEELGLAPGQPPQCTGPNGMHGERVLILTSDGIDTEQVAEYTGWTTSAVGTADGFSVIVTTHQGALLLTSSDGHSWNETPLADYSHSNVAHDTAGTTWHAGRGNGSFRIQRSGFGEAPSTAATFDGLQPGEVLAAGPAGVVATAWPLVDGGLAGVPEMRFAKDGYEVRFAQPPGGVTLWDLTEDVAVYEFGPEVMESDTPPEGVREITEDDGSVTVVFEDPETGEDLVTFTAEDLEPDIEQLRANPGGFDAFEQPPTWIGWSADGTDWGWQDAADAFGIDTADGHPWVTLAVGDDFVLARVDVVNMSDVFSDSTELQPFPPLDGTARWFIANVE